jgi:hypothetical protein
MSPQRISLELRRRISAEARHCCGYCLTSSRIIGPLLEIDHLLPESRGGTSDEANLWLACPMCNSHKSDRTEAIDPETGLIVSFFNPRRDHWSDHFVWIEDGTVIDGITPTGRATVVALNMNHPDTIAARRLWVEVGWHPPNEEPR